MLGVVIAVPIYATGLAQSAETPTETSSDVSPDATPVDGLGDATPLPTSTPADVTAMPSDDGNCPRPTDEYGALYYAVTGIFSRIYTDPGGGQFVALRRSDAAPEELLPATDDLLNRLRLVPTGSTITLVSYRVSSRAGSGGSPPFSCLDSDS